MIDLEIESAILLLKIYFNNLQDVQGIISVIE